MWVGLGSEGIKGTGRDCVVMGIGTEMGIKTE